MRFFWSFLGLRSDSLVSAGGDLPPKMAANVFEPPLLGEGVSWCSVEDGMTGSMEDCGFDMTGS
jgi:hypothetical protein